MEATGQGKSCTEVKMELYEYRCICKDTFLSYLVEMQFMNGHPAEHQNCESVGDLSEEVLHKNCHYETPSLLHLRMTSISTPRPGFPAFKSFVLADHFARNNSAPNSA